MATKALIGQCLWLSKLLLLLLALCLAAALCKRHGVAIDTKASSEVAADFVATKEWQPVAPGQRIPPGLHVRMNIQTGETEARLMDEDENGKAAGTNLPVLVDSASSSASPSNSVDEKSGGNDAGERLRQALSSQKMKAALKKIKAESIGGDSSGAGSASAGQFRSYDDLKADFAKLNAAVKTDLEVLKDLLAEWRQPNCSAPTRLRILGELEYHLRQVDNAQDFVELGGIQLLMAQINATAEAHRHHLDVELLEHRAAALRALAAGCQGNAVVQVAALKAGVLPLLVRTVQRAAEEVGDAAAGNDSSGGGRQRNLGVLALASVCRNFPLAQAVLLKSGGLAALKAAFLCNDKDAERTRLRIVTMLADFVVEAAAAASSAPESNERRRQYEQIGVARSLSETGWCELLPRPLLALPLADDSAAPDHDAAEKAVVAMATLADACRREFAADARVTAALAQLSERYGGLAQQELAEESGVPGFFCQLRDGVAELRARLMTAASGGVGAKSEL